MCQPESKRVTQTLSVAAAASGQMQKAPPLPRPPTTME